MALHVNSDYILSQDVIPHMRIDMVAGNLTELVAIARAACAQATQTRENVVCGAGMNL